MSNRFGLFLFAFTFAVASPLGAADVVSIDAATDELVRIDTATGDVTVIGALGFDAVETDLASFGSRLFAINSLINVRVDLHEVNPLSGASISSVQVPGVVSAEGLAAVGSQLKIGFNTNASTIAISDALGNLELNGVILSPSSDAFDFDALGDDGSGQLYGADGAPSVSTQLFSVNESPLAIGVFQSLPVGVNMNDVVVQGETLFGVDASGVLHKYNLGQESLEITRLNRSGEYRGLANATAIPEPSSLLNLSLAALMALAIRRVKLRAIRAF